MRQATRSSSDTPPRGRRPRTHRRQPRRGRSAFSGEALRQLARSCPDPIEIRHVRLPLGAPSWCPGCHGATRPLRQYGGGPAGCARNTKSVERSPRNVQRRSRSAESYRAMAVSRSGSRQHEVVMVLAPRSCSGARPATRHDPPRKARGRARPGGPGGLRRLQIGAVGAVNSRRTAGGLLASDHAVPLDWANVATPFVTVFESPPTHVRIPGPPDVGVNDAIARVTMSPYPTRSPASSSWP
jgi:hypothetical protein